MNGRSKDVLNHVIVYERRTRVKRPKQDKNWEEAICKHYLFVFPLL